MIGKEIYPILVLFFMGMAGVILKRNILVSILCLVIMTSSISLLFLMAQNGPGETSEGHLPLYLIIYALIQLSVGIMFSVRFYRTKKTLMTEDMKIKVH